MPRLSRHPRWLTRVRATGRPSPRQPLFLCSTHRTGSTLLRSALNTLDGVSLAGEVLNHNNKPGVADMDRAGLLAHLDECLRAERSPNPGAKVMLTHLRPDVLPADALVAAYPEARYLLLYRRDLLAQWLSMRRADESKQWTDLEGASTQASEARVHVKPARIRKYVERQRKRYEEFLAAVDGHDLLTLAYEDVDGDLAAAVARVQARFGLPGTFDAAGIPLKRQRVGEPIDLVDNWTDLEPLVAAGELELRLG